MAAVNIKLDIERLLLIGILSISAPSLLSAADKSKETHPLVLVEEDEEEPLHVLVDPRIQGVIVEFMEESLDDDLYEEEDDDEQELEREWVSDTIFLTRCPEDFEPAMDLIMTGK